MCAIDDCERFDVSRSSSPTAHREYRCSECGRWIRIGEKYHKVVGLYDGHWATYRTCRHCYVAGEWMSVVCGGYPLGGLQDELHEHWHDGYRTIPFARLIVGQKLGWHDGRDPVPTGVSELAKAMLAEAVAA